MSRPRKIQTGETPETVAKVGAPNLAVLNESIDTPAVEIDDAGLLNPDATMAVMQEVVNERIAQDAKWGQQDHPNGTGGFAANYESEVARKRTDTAARNGTLTWKLILDEEVREAFAEISLERLREELLQVAAVATAWAEAIDRDIAQLHAELEVAA